MNIAHKTRKPRPSATTIVAPPKFSPNMTPWQARNLAKTYKEWERLTKQQINFTDARRDVLNKGRPLLLALQTHLQQQG